MLTPAGVGAAAVQAKVAVGADRQRGGGGAELASAAPLDRKTGNLRRIIAGVDDDLRATLPGEVATLAKQKRELENERATLLERRESWQAAEGELDDLAAWCGRVAAKLGGLTGAEKRQAPAAFNVRVRLYRAGHQPRYEMAASLPLGMPTATPASAEQTRGTVSPPTAGRES